MQGRAWGWGYPVPLPTTYSPFVDQIISMTWEWLFFFSCGAGLGMALWILESYVVLLDVTDVHNVKGCTVTPPYLDEYGETDPGLRWVWLGMPGRALHATYDVIITSLQYHNMTLSCNV